MKLNLGKKTTLDYKLYKAAKTVRFTRALLSGNPDRFLRYMTNRYIGKITSKWTRGLLR